MHHLDAAREQAHRDGKLKSIIKVGTLVAREDGLHCDVCGYQQTWVPDFVLLGAPKKPTF